MVLEVPVSSAVLSAGPNGDIPGYLYQGTVRPSPQLGWFDQVVHDSCSTGNCVEIIAGKPGGDRIERIIKSHHHRPREAPLCMFFKKDKRE
jgi:hypothetical protein